MPTYGPASTTDTVSDFDSLIVSGAPNTVLYGTPGTSNFSSLDGTRLIHAWDLTAIPVGSTITAVSHKYRILERFGASDWAVRFYRLIPVITRSVTWNNSSAGTPWSSPGASTAGVDHDTTLIFDGTIGTDSAPYDRVWSGAGLVAMVQDAIDNRSGSFRYMIRQLSHYAEGVGVWQAPHQPISENPTLTVEYTLPGGGDSSLLKVF